MGGEVLGERGIRREGVMAFLGRLGAECLAGAMGWRGGGEMGYVWG
ncbi:MAG TPA: hypothetical protein VLL52_25065 [Anaerolineae bacterium]|nr:hypothetical protein [Anaerolineae bacterium]